MSKRAEKALDRSIAHWEMIDIFGFIWAAFSIFILATGVYFKFDYQVAFWSAIIVTNIYASASMIIWRVR